MVHLWLFYYVSLSLYTEIIRGKIQSGGRYIRPICNWKFHSFQCEDCQVFQRILVVHAVLCFPRALKQCSYCSTVFRVLLCLSLSRVSILFSSERENRLYLLHALYSQGQVCRLPQCFGRANYGSELLLSSSFFELKKHARRML